MAGILQPQFRHRFIAHLQTHDSDADVQICQQIVSVKLNYVAQTAVITIEQPMTGGALHTTLFSWCRGKHNPEIWALRGDEKPDYILSLHQAECVEHQFDFDYAASGDDVIARHILTVKFDHVVLIDPESRSTNR